MKRIRAVVFDWSGTTVDHGSVAPLEAIFRVFAAHGVPVTQEQARAPMGLDKAEHLRTLLRLPEIDEAWQAKHGRSWNNTDFGQLFDHFKTIQLEVLDDYATLVPQLPETAAWLRERGIRIGTTTGYFHAAMDRLLAAAKRQGYEPDVSVCVDDVPAGRPAPWMMYRVMEALNVFPAELVVKVGDTVHDIAEGLAAATWSVGVVRTSSEVGRTEAEWEALSVEERERLLTAARQKLTAAGAHAVLETLAELPALIADLNGRLQNGAKP